MLPEVEKLLVIQDRDQRIQALKKDLAKIPKQMEQARLKLSGDQAAVEKAKDGIKANEVAMKSLELDIQTRQNTIGRLKTQQFETRKNEEYQALGHEVERYGREISGLEDQELELMEKGENLRAKLAECEAALAKTQEVVDAELQRLEERKANEEGQIAEMEADRARLQTGIDGGVLSIYERLFKNKGDVAIAALENGQCKGCHMKVTSSTAIKVKGEKEVTNCENCGRILYLND